MLWFYRILMWLCLPILIVHRCYRDWHAKWALKRLPERFGQVPESIPQGAILLHTVSLGEVRAALPLIRALLATSSSIQLIVTTTTVTGSLAVQDLCASWIKHQRLYHLFLPFDECWMMRRFLRRLQPSLILIMETELWPNLLFTAQQAQYPLYIINARISPRSFRRYHRIRHFMSRLLRDVVILAQSRQDLSHFQALGAEKAYCIGNLKYDMQINHQTTWLEQTLRLMCQGRLVLIAASTHEGEEALVLEMFTQLRIEFPTLLLILIPRHPERFEKVAQLIHAEGLSMQRRSALLEYSTNSTACEVILIDSIGELLSIYPLANVVLMGGSFVPVGGHNLLEAAYFKKAIVMGKYHFNFTDMVTQFIREDALICCDINELKTVLAMLLRQPERCHQLGLQAYQRLQRDQGATVAVLSHLHPYLIKM